MFKSGRNLFSTFLITTVIIFMFLTPVLAFPEDTPNEDVTDSIDHPLISRFPGSYIRFYESKDYDEFTLPLNKLNEAEFGDQYQEFTEKVLRLEGKMTQHFYVVPENHSTLEIFKNYEQALKEKDFKIIAQKSGGVDGSFGNSLYEGIDFKSASETHFEGVRADIESGRYLVAKLSRAEGDVYLSLFTAKHLFHGGAWPDGQPAVFQVIIEETDLQTDLIEIDTGFEIKDTKEVTEADYPEDTPTKDVADSIDHPLISRFPDSYIRFYQSKDYDEFTLPLNKLNEAEFGAEYKEFTEKTMRLEGKMTQHFYVIPKKYSTLKIFRNYEQALKEKDFEIIAQKNGGVEERFWNQLYDGIDFKSTSETHFEAVWADKESGRFLAAKLSRAEGDVYLSLFTAKHGFYGGSWPDGQPAVFQVIIEETELQTDLINIESVMQDIKSKGKAAIYGIHFDVDSAKIKEDSKPTIEKIAELLKENPDLKLNLVGHTDSTGDLDYNIDLSERRAESLVEVLVNDYNIDKKRLDSFGVGPLAPEATNETEDGRAKNRRVELVKK
jgi:outer membrane protein OmpA-like peptidoglycan-associated protein